ncbi:PilZ domain-containing protein [Roseateles sp. YR242]|uniref:PilZ domain-containing protein n=1 Tax=Roseateles sp. YR242 TaxID=1855305 RepID=UPI0008B490C4|nr:PilZ domain-containing protein [Roseateles sp. YR242]SEK66736.1 PilZ domain-containing protein [Roseateles sp. YR242]
MTSDSAQERRHFSRIAFAGAAHLVTVDTRVAVQVLDLSLKGALLLLPPGAPVEPGGLALLDLPLLPHEGRISMAVQVAHIENDRAGLLSLGIDLESITHLRRMIELNLGDPALAERDLKALAAVPTA